MRNRKNRKFRYRSNGRSFHSRLNGGDKSRLGTNSISNGKSRNNFKPQQSAEKLADKYSTLGKEALTSGDRILSENYFQHADHFMRIVIIKNLNQNKVSSNDQTQQNNLASNDITSDQTSPEKKDKDF